MSGHVKWKEVIVCVYIINIDINNYVSAIVYTYSFMFAR